MFDYLYKLNSKIKPQSPKAGWSKEINKCQCKANFKGKWLLENNERKYKCVRCGKPAY